MIRVKYSEGREEKGARGGHNGFGYNGKKEKVTGGSWQGYGWHFPLSIIA